MKMYYFGPKAFIVMENMRNLTLSLSLSSYFVVFNLEFIAILIGIALGAYFGVKIERETYYIDSDFPDYSAESDALI